MLGASGPLAAVMAPTSTPAARRERALAAHLCAARGTVAAVQPPPRARRQPTLPACLPPVPFLDGEGGSSLSAEEVAFFKSNGEGAPPLSFGTPVDLRG